MPDPALRTLSINTATLGFQWPLPRIIAALAERGMGGIAPWRREFDGMTPAHAGRMAREAGLEVTCLCRGGFLVYGSAAERQTVLDDNRRAIDEAAELGAPALCFVVGGLSAGSKDLPRSRAQVSEMLALLTEHARGGRVRLALEPLHPMYAADRSCVNTLAQALDICDAIPGLGVMIDAYHVWWDPQLEAGLARAGQDRLLSWQICDWLVPTKDLLNDRGMMGDGVIDLPRLHTMVRIAGWRGMTEVEIFSDRWGRTDPAQTLDTCAARFLELLSAAEPAGSVP